MRTKRDVIAEIQGRTEMGHPVNSGANRRDRLYNRAGELLVRRRQDLADDEAGGSR